MRTNAAASTSAAKQEGGGGGALPVVLNEMRRADVSEYKGKTYVNIREYYQVHVLTKMCSKPVRDKDKAAAE